MILIVAFGVGLAVMASGPLAPQPGTFGQPVRTVRPAPTYAPTYAPPPPARYAPPPAYSAPRPPPTVSPDRFRPYQPQSVYSGRGGVNGYPSAPKPPGYISPYGN